jgi:hypothetical protein
MTRKIPIAIAAVVVLGLGGAGIAAATGNGPDQESGPPLSGAERDAISAAALKATNGGHVNAMERDGENGATFEAEVTKPDGKTVDVRLDDHYGVVIIEGDDEGS